MNLRSILMTTALLATTLVCAQQKFALNSPDNKIEVLLSIGEKIEYSIKHGSDPIINSSPISLTLTDGKVLGKDAKVAKSKITRIDKEILATIYKRSKIEDCYNELIIDLKGNYSIIFRAYDEGVAYRFVTSMNKPFVVQNEEVVYNFAANHKAFVPYVKGNGKTIEQQFSNSFENQYEHIQLSQWDNKRLAFSPIVVEVANNKKVALVEADLFSYPGMYLYNSNGSNTLTGMFANYPKDITYATGHNNLQGFVNTRENYIAKCDGKTTFPWRGIIIAEEAKELADSDFVYKLAKEAKAEDYSWIKPGKVAWDWWNTWNIYGVDFESGINNETYKYYIDFAASQGIEYVILDEGWAVNKKADLTLVVPEIDMKELARYAKSKNVGLILWAGYYAFDRDMENICRHYSEMGIKGFKVDFMDRDDQIMVDFHTRAAEMGTKYKMLIDFHGTYKPTGLQRTYPNVINFEGVHGLEQMKWHDLAAGDQVVYDLIIPFVRMIAGPMDYTQGAMRNANKSNYRAVYSEGMSQGTRCRQLAQYIIFESPLNMLCDSPSNYLQEEEECTKFIATVPTVWDNTIAMNGEITKYITIARKSGNDWYVGSMTDWDARTLDLDLSFLGDGNYQAEVYKDGVNADKAARDYKKEVIDIPSNKKMKISMASGGGYVMRIFKK